MGVQVGLDRIGVQRHVRHGGAQFQHRARHVVVGGHHDQALVSLGLGPVSRLDGVADRVGGREPQVHAAVVDRLDGLGHALDVGAGGLAVDAGDQQALALALLQELGGGFQAHVRGAGQHHDAVGDWRLGRRRRLVHAAGEGQEPQAPDHHRDQQGGEGFHGISPTMREAASRAVRPAIRAATIGAGKASARSIQAIGRIGATPASPAK